MDEAYRLILAWLEREFPNAAYPPEHWSGAKASAYLPPGSRVPPELEHEAVEVFAKRNVRMPAPRKELAIVRRAVVEHGAAPILIALRSQGVARRLRSAPAVRLLLDGHLMVRPWGRSSTGSVKERRGSTQVVKAVQK
jgi:hypothetical protein